MLDEDVELVVFIDLEDAGGRGLAAAVALAQVPVDGDLHDSSLPSGVPQTQRMTFCSILALSAV